MLAVVWLPLWRCDRSDWSSMPHGAMRLTAGWMMPLLVVWTELSLHVSKTGAKIGKDKARTKSLGKTIHVVVQRRNGTHQTTSTKEGTEDRFRENHKHHEKLFLRRQNMYFSEQGIKDDDSQRGVLSLIISAMAEHVVADMTEPSFEHRLSEAQAQSLRHRLKGLYSMLKDHPALMERRLHVGSKKPEIPEKLQMDKRDFDGFSLDLEQPVCPSRAEWRQLFRAKDINDTDVEVYQPPADLEGKQWFYTVICSNNSFSWQRVCQGCCIGINHDRYVSSCETKKTFVMALVRKQPEKRYDWNWIQVETSCNCAVKQLNPFDFG